MNEFESEKISINCRNLIRTVTSCKAILNLKDVDWRDWAFESADILPIMQRMTLDALIDLNNNIEDYPDLRHRMGWFISQGKKIVNHNGKEMQLCTYSASLEAYCHGLVDHYVDEIEVFESSGGKRNDAMLHTNVVSQVISKLYWILNPETTFCNSLNKMAFDVICRSKLRARDILHMLSISLPYPHFLQDECIEGHFKAQELLLVEDLRRDLPGYQSENFLLPNDFWEEVDTLWKMEPPF